MQTCLKEDQGFFSRILQIIDYKGISSVNDFALNYLNYKAPQKINRLKNKGSSPSFKIIKDIVNKFEDVDPTWLLTGKGSMLKEKKQHTKEEENSGKALEKAVAAYGSAGIKVSKASGKGPPQASINKGIPLIAVDAMDDWGKGDCQVMGYEAQRYVVPEFNESKGDFMIRVKGDSMSPTYVSGDIVACKKLPLGTFFQWNKVYVIYTIQGAMIKRIKKSGLGDHIKCISDNVDYDCFELPLQEVRSLAIVLGIIRFIN